MSYILYKVIDNSNKQIIDVLKTNSEAIQIASQYCQRNKLLTYLKDNPSIVLDMINNDEGLINIFKNKLSLTLEDIKCDPECVSVCETKIE